MRLFIGISPSDTVRAELSRFSEEMRRKVPGRYAPPELYHLTLAFLGERAEESLPALHSLMADTVATVSPFSVRLAGTGSFGLPRNAILYAAISPSAELNTLACTLRQKLEQAGESYDPTPFTPHITLARKALIPERTVMERPAPLSFSITGITLFHSVRIEGLLRYLPLFTISLQSGIPEEKE